MLPCAPPSYSITTTFHSIKADHCSVYNKRNLALRQAYFYGTSAISGALGGLVAYAIGELDGVAGWSGWRWM
jgi:hypothetical protein